MHPEQIGEGEPRALIAVDDHPVLNMLGCFMSTGQAAQICAVLINGPRDTDYPEFALRVETIALSAVGRCSSGFA